MTKEKVKEFWEEKSCGEEAYLVSLTHEGYKKHSEKRYKLEPYIEKFADFGSWKNKMVLEIGVGMGADHERLAQQTSKLFGLDITKRAINHTRNRLNFANLTSELSVGDTEKLDFPKNTFDLVYSWGVIHHTPNIQEAINEINRVLIPGGYAKIMIYNKWSITGLMLWVRYAFLTMRPWISLNKVYEEFLESPGTKAFSVSEASQLFKKFSEVDIKIQLNHSDLLEDGVGQRHPGIILNIAKTLWPKRIIKTFFKSMGLYLLVIARK